MGLQRARSGVVEAQSEVAEAQKWARGGLKAGLRRPESGFAEHKLRLSDRKVMG